MKGIPFITIALLVCATFLFVVPFGSTSGQVPPVGIIDFYGLRSVSEQQVRQTLQIREGDALPDLVKELERRLEALPNVQQARLERVCCAAVLSRLRQRSVPSLMDMARWKTGHAYAPFFILGRIGSLSEEEIQESWDSGNRSLLIETVLKRIRGRSGN